MKRVHKLLIVPLVVLSIGLAGSSALIGDAPSLCPRPSMSTGETLAFDVGDIPNVTGKINQTGIPWWWYWYGEMIKHSGSSGSSSTKRRG